MAEKEKKEDRILKATEEEQRHLAQVLSELEQWQKDHNESLIVLNQKLPGLLYQWALGEVDRTEVDKIKKQIRDIEDRLPELPIIFKLIDQREHQLARKGRQVSNLIRVRGLYEKTKAQLLEFPETHEAIKDLKTFARELGEEKEAEEFLQALPKDPKEAA